MSEASEAIFDGSDYELHVLKRCSWEDLRSVQRCLPHLVARDPRTEGQRIADRVVDAFRDAEARKLDLATELDEWLRLKAKGTT